MLVLTRRAGESIMLNDLIEVKVLRIKGKQVHIGIDAPSSTMVHRKEVWERINGLSQSTELATGAVAPVHATDADTEARAGA